MLTSNNELVSAIRRLWQQGMGGRAIAKELGKSPGVVAGHINRLGLRRNPPREPEPEILLWTDDRLAELKRMATEVTKDRTALAEHFCCSPSTISRRLNAMGISLDKRVVNQARSIYTDQAEPSPHRTAPTAMVERMKQRPPPASEARMMAAATRRRGTYWKTCQFMAETEMCGEATRLGLPWCPSHFALCHQPRAC